MIPIGTRVTITSVRDGGHRAARKLIGRTGIVTEHTGDDSPNAVAGLHRLERLLGVWCFHDDELTPDTNTQPDTGTAVSVTGKPVDQVVMRFLTHGGATVELHTQTFRKAHNTRRGEDGAYLHDWKPTDGFNWHCTGCQNYGGPYDESEPHKSRNDANHHADHCRAMPHRP